MEFGLEELALKTSSHTYRKVQGHRLEAIIDDTGQWLSLVQDRRGHLLGVATEDKLHLIEEKAGSYGPLVPIDLHSFLSYAKTLLWQGLGADPTGLVRLGDRYLDPRTGRFLTPDPLGYPLSLDLYTYAYGDPINFLDPDGWCAFAAYEKIRSSAIDLWHSPRFHGTMQTFAGVTEVLGGLAYTTATGGTGGVAGGGLLFFRGLDDLYTGLRQVLSNEWADSAKSQVLQSFGVSHAFAEGIDTALSFGSPKKTSSMISWFGKPEESVQYTKSNLRLGQQVHRSYKAGETVLNKKTKEFVLPSGRRIDFLDRVNGKVYELKPNNPRAIREGQKQLQRYIEELKTVPKFKDTQWEGILETY